VLEPGLRDRLVTLQGRAPEDAVGPSGRPVEVWTDLDVVPAHKRSMTGSEVYRASQWTAKASGVFEVNYRSDCDPDRVDVAKLRRLVYEGRVHDVVQIEEVGRRDGLLVYTVAGAWL